MARTREAATASSSTLVTSGGWRPRASGTSASLPAPDDLRALDRIDGRGLIGHLRIGLDHVQRLSRHAETVAGRRCNKRKEIAKDRGRMGQGTVMAMGSV